MHLQGADGIRLISARKADKRQRNTYEKGRCGKVS